MLSVSRNLLMEQVSSEMVQQNGDAICTADKTEGKVALPKAVNGEHHSPLGS
jgi:hypothetical protein